MLSLRVDEFITGDRLNDAKPLRSAVRKFRRTDSLSTLATLCCRGARSHRRHDIRHGSTVSDFAHSDGMRCCGMFRAVDRARHLSCIPGVLNRLAYACNAAVHGLGFLVASPSNSTLVAVSHSRSGMPVRAHLVAWPARRQIMENLMPTAKEAMADILSRQPEDSSCDETHTNPKRHKSHCRRLRLGVKQKPRMIQPRCVNRRAARSCACQWLRHNAPEL